MTPAEQMTPAESDPYPLDAPLSADSRQTRRHVAPHQWLAAERATRHQSRLAYRVGKRLFDLLVGSALLIIASPIILVAAMWIRLDSAGSPFFFQTRLGRDGKLFRICKLRGMYLDARERYPELYDYSHNRDLDFYFHYENDPRVTKAGKLFRRTSIDELPNLWNVVLGDMSLVGPRPEIPDVLAMYGGHRDEYLSVKPGITCRSKITGRDVLSKRETVELDLQYIRNRGFSEDLSILWKTFLSVISRRNVY
jgi:lipopolysaccharide/colanic/teichoic acid biosynthesis glycosyltransferase